MTEVATHAGAAAQSDAAARLARLHLLGTERPYAAESSVAIADEAIALLEHPGFRDLTPPDRGAALFRVLLIYSGRWNAEGRRLIPAAERAFADLVADAPDNFDALCNGYDALFFLYWCWGASMREQTGFASRVVAPFAAAIRAQAPPVVASPTAGVGLLAEFLTPGPGNAIAVANQVLLRSLAEQRRRGPIFLYAWLFHDPATLAAAEALGIQVRPIAANSPAERLALTEAAIRADAPEVLISDMNAAIPAALFERRVAPVQILYQFGMPFWPLAALDGLFRVWDFEPALAGYDPRRCVKLTIPYDLTPFAAAADPARLAAERARLPAGRLVGTYGRLAKLTPEFVAAVAEGVRAHPDVQVVFGGTGDGGPLRAAIAATGLAERFTVIEGYVDGHLWGHLLEVFLDSFPQPGGASALEMLAKHKPVVALRTAEAPNVIGEQRVASLVAADPAEYGSILSRLLGDPAFAAAAAAATSRLARAYPTAAGYGRELFAAIDRVRRLSGRGGSWQRWLGAKLGRTLVR